MPFQSFCVGANRKGNKKVSGYAGGRPTNIRKEAMLLKHVLFTLNKSEEGNSVLLLRLQSVFDSFTAPKEISRWA